MKAHLGDQEIINILDAKVPCKDDKGKPCVPICKKSFCQTTCQFKNSTFVNSNSGDCHKYNICLDGNPVTEVTCEGEKKYFSMAEQACTDNEYDCCDYCIPYCIEKHVQIIDPSNCGRFYYCKEVGIVKDRSSVLECPSGQLFNSTKGHCSEDITDGDCTPLCDTDLQETIYF